MSDNFDKGKDIVLFYTPEAQVVPHYIAQCMVASTLKAQGYKVLMAYCPGIMTRCPVMDMTSHSFEASQEETSKLCQQCTNTARALLHHYGLEGVDLGSTLEP